MITIAILRAAGIPEALIVRVVEIEEKERLAEEASRLDKRREQTKLRVRKHRAPVTHVTHRNGDTALQEKHQPDQTPRHADERYTAHILTSLPSSSLSSSIDRPLPTAARAKRKTAHALSAQWVLSEADRNFATTRNWPQARIDSEEQRFRDYWLANGKAKADWAATWRNWVTSPYQTNGGQRGNGQGRRHGSVLDAFDRLGERLKAAGATDDYIPGSSGPRPLELDTQVRPAGLKLVPKR